MKGLKQQYEDHGVKKSNLRVNCEFEKCPGYLNCSMLPSEVWYAPKKRIEVLFVLSPPSEDFARNRVFSSKTGKVFKKAVSFVEKELGRPVNKAFAPLVRRYDKKGYYWSFCKNNLIKDIEKLKPKLIVAVGPTATSALLKDSFKEKVNANKSILTRTIPLNGKTYPLFPMYDTSMVYNESSVLCAVVEDLRRILGVYTFKPMTCPENKIAPMGANKPIHRHIEIVSSTEHEQTNIYDMSKSTEVIDTTKSVLEVVKHLINVEAEAIAVDTETKNLNRRYGNVLDSVQFCYDPKTTYFIYVDHPLSPFSPEEKILVKSYLRKLFSSRKGATYWVMHNAKYDIAILYSLLGIRIPKPVICTMMFSFMLEENYIDSAIGGLGLKHLSKKYGFTGFGAEELIARGAGKLRDLNEGKYIEYAGNDVSATIQLYYILKNMAEGQKYLKEAMLIMTKFYDKVLKFLVEMEYNGIYLDKNKLNYLKSNKSPINTRLEEIVLKDLRNSEAVRKTNELLVDTTSLSKPLFKAPWSFDINKVAHKQLLFFDILKIKPLKSPKTSCIACKGKGKVNKEKCSRCKGTGRIKGFDKDGCITVAGSTFKPGAMNKEFQGAYKDRCKEVALYDEYNKLKKLKTSYIAQIEKFLDPKNGFTDHYTDGKLRPSFILTTKTGRSRAKHPNSQQIPRGDTPVKKAIKNLFCAPPGYGIVSLDYMGIEVRGWGALSGDKTMEEMFKKAKYYRDLWRKTENPKYKQLAQVWGDIHTVNASAMFNVPFEKVEKSMRQMSKSLTFGAIYGRSLKSMAIGMGCTVEEAEERQKKAFSKFKEAGQWLNDIEKVAEKNLYVQSPLGKRRRLWDFLLIDAKSWLNRAKRQSRNSPIQSFASDITFLGASLMFDELIIKAERNWEFFNAVHDSVYLRVPIDEIKECVLLSEKFFTTKLIVILKEQFNYEVPFPLEAEFEIGIYGGELTKWDFSMTHLDQIVDGIRKEDVVRQKKLALENKPYKLEI